MQRTRNVGYDDDDLYDDDDYYEEEEAEPMSADDKEQMRTSTASAREALGSAGSNISDAQIQEALWHYYYDVGKSVSYLKNKFAAVPTEPKPDAQPKKDKVASRFDQAANAAGEKAPVPAGKQSFDLYSCVESTYPVAPLPPNTMPSTTQDFFADAPWGNVPIHRRGVITIDEPCFRGGLLGGSSKLAALAAKRRKEREEAQAASSASAETDAAVAMLDKLTVKSRDASTAEEADRPSRLAKYTARKRSPSPKPEAPVQDTSPEPEAPKPAIQVEHPAQRATASMFASTLCTTPKKKKPAALANGDRLADSVEKLAVDEPKVKSKNLNVLDELQKSGMKRMANFVVVGHVDHGKSTLMGRLLYDLKVIDQRSIDKLRKEAETIGKSSFALAWVMDETSEERSRGITVDIATNYFETDTSRFTILDAPGHKDFIPNMISGSSQADFPVLVIDSSTNSFEAGLKGQTKEHILIARSMGMQHIIVAVNKMDTVAWSKGRFDEITKKMTAFLTDASFAEKRITFIPLAGLTGENVVKKIKNPAAEWYTGETLLEALERIELPERQLEKPLRLSVADVFRGDMRSPLSISGRIDAGTLQVGDVILALPANETATIKSIEVQDAPVDWAVAGQIPTLHLADIDPVHLRQGDMVCSPRAPVKLVKAFTSKLLAFEHVLPMPVEVFRSTLNSPGSIRVLSAKLNKFTGEVTKKKPRIVKPGEVARVVVQLERELPIEEGMRVVVRERGRTIGAGLMENVA
ncbi:hypothetical protein N0V95_006207 [Ascochyta clinopodiicola]|nr:hypothetical protein N0V95_006207 [Ascochyta clinopodiicola]